jgi:hypothetical protein
VSYLTVAVSILGVLVSLYRQFWSDSAILKRLELKLTELKARQDVEAERLRALYDRIDREPETTGQNLADQLNRSSDQLRGSKP